MNKHQKRKETPVFRGVLQYFPNAIQYVSQVSLAGNQQHHPDEPLHWDMSKSTDEADALIRHAIDMGVDGDVMDDDGILHAGKVAWRGLANLERVLRARATIEGNEDIRNSEVPGLYAGLNERDTSLS